MTHHERHGPHPIAEWEEPRERSHGEEMIERLELERSAPAAPAIPFSWQGLKELGYVGGALVGLVGVYYGVVGEVRDSRKDIEALTARVVVIEQGRAVNLPRLEEIIRSNGLQDQRLQNLTESLGSLRQTVVDVARSVAGTGEKLGDMRERQAILEERLGHAGPHDR